jgi:predicted nucleic acid-binding protein
MMVLDTDVVSAVMRAEPSVVDWLNRQPVPSLWTTVITVFEIRYGLAVMPGGRRRSSISQSFDDVLVREFEGRVLAFDEAAAEQAASLMAQRRAEGRMQSSTDTMIAGIAVSHNATLVTRNTRHFHDVGVPVVNPWHG